MRRFGKEVGGSLYIHVSIINRTDRGTRETIDRAAAAFCLSPEFFNVVRIDGPAEGLALLDYPTFFDDAFPRLARSWKYNRTSGAASFRDYRSSLNPPILHRKELLLAEDHPDRRRFTLLTEDCERLGLFDDTVRIGYESQWQALLRERGYRVVDHQLLPIGNAEDDAPLNDDETREEALVQRHRTALSRQTLSAPVSAMLRLGLLGSGVTFFDYGCGRGSDVAGLREAGFRASGWDPYFAPNQPLAPAQIVNLGFVINVIEDPVERRDALRRAFALADIVLCVATMVATEEAVRGRPFADGVLTQRNTFQKYYTQTELARYLEDTLQISPIPVSPGIFLAFKDVAAEQRFQMARARSRLRVIRQPVSPYVPKPVAQRSPKSKALKPIKPPPSPRIELWERCPEAFAALCKRWAELGREPAPEEVAEADLLKEIFGSISGAYRAALPQLDSVKLETARQQRREDLLVYLALQRFRRRKPYRQLEPTLQRDVRAFFGDYVSALDAGMQLLAAAADPKELTKAARQASEKGLGWLVEGKSLQLHSSLVSRLPAVLRTYIGCAGILYGDIEMADLVKIHLSSGKVTMLRCDDFQMPLPKLIERVKVNLRTQDIDVFSYGAATEFIPPVVFLKSRFMNEEMLGYADQAEFDLQLEGLVTVDENGRGPTEEELAVILKRANLRMDGTALVEGGGVPHLDDPCGEHLTFRDLIVCGETALQTGLPNLPESPDSYKALRALAEQVLDPVIEWFGTIELTYGFAGSELARHIHGRIAPNLDQHAAHETNRSGELICRRLGASVDFLVRDEDMEEVARWVMANTPFDRLYFYGADRPIHVSYGPEHKREAIEMVLRSNGRRVPRRMPLVR